MQDQVNHPKHYTSHPSGIEAIEVTQFMSFTLGNAFKYLFRAEEKNGDTDYRKALWYIDREIAYRQERGEPLGRYRPGRYRPGRCLTVQTVADADPRPEIAKAMRHIGKAAFQHTGTSDLECAREEVLKWLKNSNG